MSSWVPTEKGAHLRRRRTSGTSPEVALRRALHACGLRFRLGRVIDGYKPDIELPRYRTAIFADGCFWHGCPAHSPRVFKWPNAQLWTEKISANRARDRAAIEALNNAGWSCLRIWECEIEKDYSQTIKRVLDFLRAAPPS